MQRGVPRGCELGYARAVRVFASLLLLSSLLASTAAVRSVAAQEPRRGEASDVEAPSVESAEARYRRGDLPGALEAFDATLRAGGLEGSTLARVHWHLGVLHAIVGDEAAARTDFASALAIDPSLPMPDELPPEKQALFASVRRDTQRAELHVEPLEVDPEGETILRVVAPPLATRTRLEVTPPDGEPWSVETSSTSARVDAAAWRGAPRLVVRAIAFDAYGNVVARTSVSLVAPRRSSEPVEGPERYALPYESPPERSVAKSPWLWLGIGAVVIGGAVAAVLLTTRDTRYVAEPSVVRPGLVLTWP
jgi:hypothetical protein